MEEKERKSEKLVTQSEFCTGRLKRSTRELFLMTMQQIKVSLYLVIVISNPYTKDWGISGGCPA